MDWTEEQQAIIEEQAPNMKVQARAGTGKTSTMVGYTERRPNRKFLYLVFNSANRKEAEQRFPDHVTPLTIHSLAYRAVGWRYKDKLGDPRPVDISRSFGVSYRMAADGLGLLQRYLSSPHAQIEDCARPNDAAALPLAADIWQAMRDRKSASVPMMHDGYLKIFGLERRPIPFDGIVFDEAQDADPVTLSILLQQDTPLVAVGDDHQSIYSFRGAVNAMAELSGVQHHLTRSFRFGPEVASAANAVLRQFGEKSLLEGCGGPSVVSDGPRPEGPYAYLSRSNAGVIQHAITAAAAGKSMHFVGKRGLSDYRTDRLLDVYRLYGHHSTEEIKDREIKKFESFDELVSYAEAIEDPELKAIIGLVKDQGHKLPALITDLYRRSEGPGEDADVTLATYHRSKGLEFDIVELGDSFDWEKFKKDRDAGKIDEHREELNLLYVAATRGRKFVKPNAELKAAMAEVASGVALSARANIKGPAVLDVRRVDECRIIANSGSGPSRAPDIRALQDVLPNESSYVVEYKGQKGILVEEVMSKKQLSDSPQMGGDLEALGKAFPKIQTWLVDNPEEFGDDCVALQAFVPARYALDNERVLLDVGVRFLELAGRDPGEAAEWVVSGGELAL